MQLCLLKTLKAFFKQFVISWKRSEMSVVECRGETRQKGNKTFMSLKKFGAVSSQRCAKAIKKNANHGNRIKAAIDIAYKRHEIKSFDCVKWKINIVRHNDEVRWLLEDSRWPLSFFGRFVADVIKMKTSN